ncbi:MAG: MAPEG family protein [Alphaproteobacteria bacterium]|nr:MAPEG family protein [Alphaproteobacteria bacterium]
MRGTANRRSRPMPALTAFYGGLLALLFLGLSLNVIRRRYHYRVAFGSDGPVPLQRAIRGQANFAEYVPLALLLLLCLELLGGPAWALHAVGLCLLAGRLAHGICFACLESAAPLRVGGMLLTFAALITAAIGNLAMAVNSF